MRMRLRFGGSVIILNRKQLVIIGLLATVALVGVLHVGSQVTASTDLDDDDDSVRPVPIEDVLRRRRAGPAQSDAGVAEDSRRRRRRGRSDRFAMAMDEARQLRGATIDAARRQLIADQRRAPDARYNINVTLSDLTSPDRDLPDTRPPVCRSMNYTTSSSSNKHLPTASVIIPFYNEALTMILRAVHSVLNRSPDNLLDEVIMTAVKHSPVTNMWG